MNCSKYRISPKIVWLNDHHNAVKVFTTLFDPPIHLNGVESILWRAIWQRFPITSWEKLAQEENTPIYSTITHWIALGLIEEENH